MPETDSGQLTSSSLRPRKDLRLLQAPQSDQRFGLIDGARGSHGLGESCLLQEFRGNTQEGVSRCRISQGELEEPKDPLGPEVPGTDPPRPLEDLNSLPRLVAGDLHPAQMRMHEGLTGEGKSPHRIFAQLSGDLRALPGEALGSLEAAREALVPRLVEVRQDQPCPLAPAEDLP